YWKKAEALRHKWLWTSKKAEEIGQIVVEGKWQLFPPQIMELFPHFSDVNISTITRGPDWWVGARRALVKEAEEKRST
ncbi:MAG TPA: hypothetical protein DCY57_09185, partial [Bacteroidetes bacterium]|nr:hypothetical protein [Bacteroidota bacterium]